MPFRILADVGRRFRPGREAAPGMAGPGMREGVDAGVKVIDLAAMKAELEKLRGQQTAAG